MNILNPFNDSDPLNVTLADVFPECANCVVILSVAPFQLFGSELDFQIDSPSCDVTVRWCVLYHRMRRAYTLTSALIVTELVRPVKFHSP